MKRLLAMLLCVAIPATGISSGAMMFDGVDDYVGFGNDQSLNFERTDSFSISMWLKTSSVYKINKQLSAPSYQGWMFGTEATGELSLMLRNTDVGNKRLFVKTTSTGYTSDTWHFITVTYNGNQDPTGIVFYDNGVEDSAKTTITDTMDGDISSAAVVELGRFVGTPTTSYFNGSIDEVLIYNKSLTASEVQAMYAAGGAWYPRTGLVSRWSMDGNNVSSGGIHANGTTIRDSEGSNNGTVSDGADNSMTLQSSPVREKRGRR